MTLELTKKFDVDEEVHRKCRVLSAKGKFKRVNDFLRAILKLDPVEAPVKKEGEE